MDDLQENIGKRIKAARTAAGLTQQALGAELGKKIGAISKYERGVADPGTLGLVKIAEATRVSVLWLITGKGPGEELQQTDPVEVLIFSNPQTVEKIKERLRCEVREELTTYKVALPQDVEHLIDVWRHASPEIKGAALTILEQSAKESRQIEGGGSDSAVQGSA